MAIFYGLLAVGVGAILVSLFGFYSIPLFPLWILVKGWDNTGIVVKIIAVIVPLFGLANLITQNAGEGNTPAATAWLIAAPFVNYGLLYFAYARRDQMFNV